jgi:hypothetical protein
LFASCSVFLKRKLGREGFKAYNENQWIRAAATVLTFGYCAASMVFYANTFAQIWEIFPSCAEPRASGLSAVVSQDLRSRRRFRLSSSISYLLSSLEAASVARRPARL